MKFLTILLLCATVLCHAQWNTNGTTAYYTGGNVAIGRNTTYVDARLHVKAPTVSAWGFMSEASSNSRVIGVGHDGTAGYISVSDTDGGSGFSPLNLRTSNLVRLGIATNGNVGIGTQSPDYLLQVYNTNSPNNPTLAIGKANVNTAGQSTLWFFAGNGTAANGFKIEYNKTATTDRLAFFGGSGTEMLTLKNAGSFVGIGASEPRAKLDLGFGGGPTLVLNPGTTTNVNFTGLYHNDLIMGSWIDNNQANAFMSIGYKASPDRKFHIGTASSETFSSATFVPHFTVSAGGNVGIGTPNPDKTLTVNGIIHTKEVLVDLNVPGPDYVFEKDYDLLPLEALEAYINENKHLPEVPSAKEMEASGLNLKEMNLLLLKKVEELTLHVIELKKENEQQSKEIQKLKRR
ncbi:hypothetical protein KK083_24630 [Fulvivirgaceae bacterium PWU4]|uniref:Peptidase S74 domain-containing protein n=1 Tax=Chryseosolibacter histidini TaxID=2782349 RepID=A0AAP2DRW8_9BACT|nr:hypothetical protein [Chryseosolibacter histidini]MBT1700097.1 hypothetical protein [Chryseosolibacter histidini]